MDGRQIFTDSWWITWRRWHLWLITFFMLLTFTPSLFISMSFSFLVQSVHMPSEISEPFYRINPLYSLPEEILTVLAFAGLAFMVVSLSLSWMLQAAAMRIISNAVEGTSLSLRQAFSLGKARFFNIIKLSIAFGFIIAVIAYTPILLFFLAPKGTPAEILFRLIQPIFGPLNILLNFIILFLLMAVALDKSSAQDSVGRAWNVFKSSWERFVVVIVGTSMITILIALLMVPLALVLAILVFVDASPIFLAGAVIFIGLIALVLLIFQGVFSLVLYTVTYRSSSNGSSLGQKAVEVYVV
jgi:hypothetical protein